MTNRRIRVVVNAYGIVCNALADTIAVQDALELVGVTDVVSDWRIKVIFLKGRPVYTSTLRTAGEMRAAGGRAPRPAQLWTTGPTCDEIAVVGSFIRLPVPADRSCREP